MQLVLQAQNRVGRVKKRKSDFFQPQCSHNSARFKAITASIARFIAKDLRLTYSVVESGDLWDMIKAIKSRYKIPSISMLNITCYFLLTKIFGSMYLVAVICYNWYDIVGIEVYKTD